MLLSTPVHSNTNPASCPKASFILSAITSGSTPISTLTVLTLGTNLLAISNPPTPSSSQLTPTPPGTGFATFTLPPPLRRLTLGICMDLNAQPPALWSVAEGPYEIAEHARKEGSGLLVLLNNWLDSGE